MSGGVEGVRGEIPVPPSDWGCLGYLLGERVSIHAPVWGATPWHSKMHHAVSVSIHAPVWGATVADA